MAMNLAKMLRLCLVQAINECSESQIISINANEVAMMDFCNRAINEARRRLRELGHEDLVNDGTWDSIKALHQVRSMIPNANKMLEDLRDLAPASIDRAKLALWTSKWKEETAKAKRAKDLFASGNPSKRAKTAQDPASTPHQAQSSLAGTASIVRTLKNHMCGHVMSIPNEVIKRGRFIGEGAYGSCREITIENVSFFPPSVTYCAKMYKGDVNNKLDQFQKEKGMQKVNASLVRCIAFTSEAPWISIFPLYNGGTINDMLFFIPFKESYFRRVTEKLEKGLLGFRPDPDVRPNASQLEIGRAHV